VTSAVAKPGGMFADLNQKMDWLSALANCTSHVRLGWPSSAIERLGPSGSTILTSALLVFDLDQALARDVVHAELDAGGLAEPLGRRQIGDRDGGWTVDNGSAHICGLTRRRGLKH
jgi:hypothetical protein